MNALLFGIPVAKEDQVAVKIVNYVPGPGAAHAKADCCGILVWLGEKQLEKKKADPWTCVVCPSCILPFLPSSEVKHLGGVGSKYVMADGTELPPRVTT